MTAVIACGCHLSLCKLCYDIVCHFHYSLAINAGTGLFFEAGADLVYPMDEIVTSSIFVMVNAANGAVYMMMGSNINSTVMNWILAGVFTLGAVVKWFCRVLLRCTW